MSEQQKSNTKLLGTQVKPEEEDCEEKAAVLVGEVQKSLPSISGTLSYCTFNFN